MSLLLCEMLSVRKIKLLIYILLSLSDSFGILTTAPEANEEITRMEIVIERIVTH